MTNLTSSCGDKHYNSENTLFQELQQSQCHILASTSKECKEKKKRVNKTAIALVPFVMIQLLV